MNALAHTAGQGSALVSDDFAVPDIRCAGCISKLENGLVRNSGIANARVNFTAKRVTLEHDPALSLPDMVGAFLELGFEAHPLEQENGDATREDSKQLMRAMAVAGFAMMNIMLLSVSVWSGAGGVTRDMFHWLSALIALPTVAYAGQPFFRSAWRALRMRRTNMDVPISIGVLLATGMSLYETATSGPHAYFDSAVMLLFFLLVGRYLDSMMRDRARSGVTALLKNMGTGAMVIGEDGRERWVDTTALEPGMVMTVAAGERFAADGEIIEGTTRIDKSLLTGESESEAATCATQVHAGTLNMEAPVRVRISAAGEDTTLADLARLMGEAAQGKSRYVRIADRAARFYAPAVHSLALIAFAGWILAGIGVHQSLLIAVAVLIITCPCALGLAVPAAQIVSAGALMRAGVLVKDGSAIERLSEVDSVAFDKTGTLTLGRPEPQNLDQLSRDEKSIALALASVSRHPLSQSLSAALRRMDILPADISNATETVGQGVTAMWRGKTVSLGRPAGDIASDKLVTALAISSEERIVSFTDDLRPEAERTTAMLAKMGLDGIILSGDRPQAVSRVAGKLGITALVNLLPQEKLDFLKKQQALGRHILMVGDGLNDGPALAAAHASMAPATASDAGKNAADLVWMGDSLMPVVHAVRAARRTQQIVRQNFALAICYNIVAVPLALLGMVTPLIAAIAMSGSSLIVVANALRLRSATA